MVPTSAPSERDFSTYNWIHDDARNRLAFEQTHNYVKIQRNHHILPIGYSR